MKFNWGTGITLFVIAFVLMNLAFLWYTRSFSVDLVEEDYYPKELKHEEHLNKIRNADSLSGRMTARLTEQGVLLTIPGVNTGRAATGSIHIYRPSDERLDRRLDLNTDSAGVQVLDPGLFSRGRYVLKVQWSDGLKQYYKEAEIFLP